MSVEYRSLARQLIAESTGKHGKGMIPIDGEEVGSPGAYGADRLFIYLRLESGADSSQDAAVDALEHAAHPVVRIGVADIYDIGQEFFRWEMAVAIAGAIIGINPFDQPDVEASKAATRALHRHSSAQEHCQPIGSITRTRAPRTETSRSRARSISFHATGHS
jgi:transaldolase/glucose-6-phosphate isomerase